MSDEIRLLMTVNDVVRVVNEHCEQHGVHISHDPAVSTIFHITTPSGMARAITLGGAVEAALAACTQPDIGPGIFICKIDD